MGLLNLRLERKRKVEVQVFADMQHDIQQKKQSQMNVECVAIVCACLQYHFNGDDRFSQLGELSWAVKLGMKRERNGILGLPLVKQKKNEDELVADIQH